MAMEKTHFWPDPPALSLAEAARLCGAELARSGADEFLTIRGVGSLDFAGPADVTFYENPKYLGLLDTCRAAACIVAPRNRDKVPAHMALLLSPQPAAALGRLSAALYPDSLRPLPWFAGDAAGADPRAVIHAAARLEYDVLVEPLAVIGAGAEIGAGTRIGPGAVIGCGVKIGRDCSIGANVTIQHALIGNRVIIHPGVRVGQDGFGYVMGPRGHAKLPQIGRVIIQDNVEIGANTAIDRGAIRDTIIGEGTKIDNQVQIGHNVTIGRHCVIVGNVALAGSCTLEDFVAIGGQSGVNNHVTVGMGAQIAAASHVAESVPPGERWAGTPATQARIWLRALNHLKRLGERAPGPAANAAEKAGAKGGGG